MDSCKLCEKRRPRRYCPGVGGEICPRCCGEEREVTVNCPFDCPHLVEARRFERLPELGPDDWPHKDIPVSRAFLEEREPVLALLAALLLDGAERTRGAVDADLAEALEAMIRTYRTRQTGLVYETRPNNPLAAAIQQHMNAGIAQLEQRMAERSGLHLMRDKDMLGLLVYLRRMLTRYSNGRRLGRRFLHVLRSSGAETRPGPEPMIVTP
jgi:hypothetical protein